MDPSKHVNETRLPTPQRNAKPPQQTWSTQPAIDAMRTTGATANFLRHAKISFEAGNQQKHAVGSADNMF